MKIILLLTATFLGISAYPSTQQLDLEWTTFKMTHQKNYARIEELKRVGIFQSNLVKIAENNKLFDEGKVSYQLGVTQFADLTHEEFVQYLNGLKASRPKHQNNTVTFALAPEAAVPASIDWREKGAVTAVKNQRSCGSCWAFSTTGSLESQNFLKNGKLISLSEQELVDCSHERGNDGCKGGEMNPAFEYVAKNGLSTEEEYPAYDAKDHQCRRNVLKSAVKNTGFVQIPTTKEENLKEAVGTEGPVSVAVDASYWQLYRSGVYRDLLCGSDQESLNHGVLAVGYGEQDGSEYWIIKNSWGATWGEKGYIRLARNAHNNCGVATDSSYPTFT